MLNSQYNAMHSGGVDGACMCLLTDHSTRGFHGFLYIVHRQMPEWILRPWPRVRFQFLSLKRLIWNNITKKATAIYDITAGCFAMHIICVIGVGLTSCIHEVLSLWINIYDRDTS
jgi:hypothetical protein